MSVVNEAFTVSELVITETEEPEGMLSKVQAIVNVSSFASAAVPVREALEPVVTDWSVPALTTGS